MDHFWRALIFMAILDGAACHAPGPTHCRDSPSIAPIGPFTDPRNIRVEGKTGLPNDAYFNEISTSYRDTDVSSLIHIRSVREVRAARSRLIQFIWKGGGFPDEKMPAAVVLDVPDPLRTGAEGNPIYPELPDLARVDRLIVKMDYGLRSVVYYYHPRQDNGRLLIWHQGHDRDLGTGGGHRLIAYALQRGFSVLALWMPLFGENQIHEKLVFYSGCAIPGVAEWDGLHDFKCMETASFTPLKWFVEPVAVALNYALRQQSYSQVAMAGLSGGGWTTTLYAALDPRVQLSFPTAGSLPFYLSTEPYEMADRNYNDFEQWGSAAYTTIADYPDLYVLGASGPGRQQMQILNKHDDCCFAGVRYHTYQDYVKDAVRAAGDGSFSVFLDDSERGWTEGAPPSHQISRFALRAVIAHALNGDSVQFVHDGDNTYWNGCGTDRDTYFQTGGWEERTGAGLASHFHVAPPGTGEAEARWQFQITTPGTYQVAVTWVAAPGQATNARYAIRGRDNQSLAPVREVNQQTPPDDFEDAEVGWKILDNITVAKIPSAIAVTESNDANGVVNANGAGIFLLDQPQ